MYVTHIRPTNTHEAISSQLTLKVLSDKAYNSSFELASELSDMIDRWREELIAQRMTKEMTAYDFKIYLLDELRYGSYLFGWTSEDALELLLEIDYLTNNSN
ncbi:hypothetical protein [Streptococcus cuniculi]|uniref:Uncharacterized protein n=1 Tax=Streptococcus cuniculi TaxID=1432788 RepID=A0A4Y9JDX5_9STRE|nr:hypothetical protein [Streptococcus cuniculi]MBF0777861.1 hypothetical protein [Streptococcus cuniculi]TFU98159.1 hypothetical protein E4T82_03880 [Streptococcus cuniculi]